MNDPEYLELLTSQARAFNQVANLVEVTDAYREKVILVMSKIVANQTTTFHCYQISQLSELGTGLNSNFENGSCQSDKREDVLIQFINCICGEHINIRLREDELTYSTRNIQSEKLYFPNAVHNGSFSRKQACDILDGIFYHFWYGKKIEQR